MHFGDLRSKPLARSETGENGKNFSRGTRRAGIHFGDLRSFLLARSETGENKALKDRREQGAVNLSFILLIFSASRGAVHGCAWDQLCRPCGASPDPQTNPASSPCQP